MSKQRKPHKRLPERSSKQQAKETFFIKDSTDSPMNINDVKIEFPFKSKSKYKSVAPQLKNKNHDLEYDLNPTKQQTQKGIANLHRNG